MTDILLVDDDAIIRRSLKTRIDWEKHGWNLAFAARDAVEAMDYLKSHEVQIIITDISMPGMNGIKMAQLAQNYDPLIKFIFISGYKDFEYAKQVLKLNAIGYLTKPLSAEELVEAIAKAEQSWQKEQKAAFIISEKYPQIKREYISRLMAENFQKVDASVFSAFDINLNTGLGIVGFLEIDYNRSSPYDLVYNRLSNLCADLTDQYPGSLFFCMDNLRLFFIFTCPDARNECELDKKLRLLCSYAETFSRTILCGNGVSLFRGTPMRSLNELYGSYQAAMQAVSSDTERLLSAVHRYIEEHYSDCELSLLAIAEHFHINHCYLTSIFKRKFQTNLYDYLIQVRMEEAARLILSTPMKNYEIAAATGYKNAQYFSLCFKKYYGCTITEFKSQKKN